VRASASEGILSVLRILGESQVSGVRSA